MNQLQAMRVFIRVVELNSFSLAGRQLGMSNAAITRHIGMLEAHLNMRLLNRSTRTLSLTEAGQRYLDGCRTVVEKLDEIESDLVRVTRAPTGVLRIAVPSVFAGRALAGLLCAYRSANPRIDYVVTVYDAPVNIIDGGFDLCFSTSRHPASTSLVSRTLTSVEEIAVAAPAYLAARGAPQNPLELARHELIALTSGPRIWEFPVAGKNENKGTDKAVNKTANETPGEARRVNVNGPLTASSYAMVREAALSGMGIALLPLPLVEQDFERGALQRVLESHAISGGTQQISLVYPGRNYLASRVRSFIDFTVEAFRAAPA